MGVPWCTPKMVGLQWKVHENMDDFGGNLVDTLWIKWMDVNGIPKKNYSIVQKRDAVADNGSQPESCDR